MRRGAVINLIEHFPSKWLMIDWPEILGGVRNKNVHQHLNHDAPFFKSFYKKQKQLHLDWNTRTLQAHKQGSHLWCHKATAKYPVNPPSPENRLQSLLAFRDLISP